LILAFETSVVHRSPFYLSNPDLSQRSLYPTTTPQLFRKDSSIVKGRRKKNTKLQSSSAFTGPLALVNTLWRNHPYAAAALICGVKASAADLFAQGRQIQKEEDIDLDFAEIVNIGEKADFRRNIAYIIYGALYQGVAQEYIYNHLYPLMFGAGRDFRTIICKVSFDLLVQAPFLTLPIAYASNALIYRYSLKKGFRRYLNDIKKHGLLVKFFALWGPVQTITFRFIPQHLRISFIAFVSFFWLIILYCIVARPKAGSPKVDKPKAVNGSGKTRLVQVYYFDH